MGTYFNLHYFSIPTSNAYLKQGVILFIPLFPNRDHRIMSSSLYLTISVILKEHSNFLKKGSTLLEFILWWLKFTFVLFNISTCKERIDRNSYIYMQSWKLCPLPVMWQLMHLGTWCTVTHCWHQWTKECSTS